LRLPIAAVNARKQSKLVVTTVSQESPVAPLVSEQRRERPVAELRGWWMPGGEGQREIVQGTELSAAGFRLTLRSRDHRNLRCHRDHLPRVCRPPWRRILRRSHTGYSVEVLGLEPSVARTPDNASSPGA